MSRRTSYPAAENLEHALKVLEFNEKSDFPKPLISNLTKKYKNKFPILYEATKSRHLTADYFQLLEMVGLCKLAEKNQQWYVFEFSRFMQDFTDFPSQDIQTEILNTIKEFKIGNRVKIFEITSAGRELLRKKGERTQLLLSLFYRFFRLDPPYFRYLIQHSSTPNIASKQKSGIQDSIFLIVRAKFPKFVKDDATRIMRWAEYFQIIQKEETANETKYRFSLETIVQYIGHVLTCYINEKTQNQRNFVWVDLESLFYKDIFYPESFLRCETLLEILLDQNPEKYRWRIIERGPGRYNGFRGNPAWQLLQLKETPLHYNYQSHHVSRVVKS